MGFLELFTRPLGGQEPEPPSGQKEPGVVMASGMIIKQQAKVSFLQGVANTAQTLFGGGEEQPEPRPKGPGRLGQALSLGFHVLTQPLGQPEESEPGMLSTMVQAARLGAKEGVAKRVAQAAFNAAFGVRPEPEAPKERKSGLLRTLIGAGSLGAKQAMTEGAAQAGYNLARIPGAVLGGTIKTVGLIGGAAGGAFGWVIKKGVEGMAKNQARAARRQQQAAAQEAQRRRPETGAQSDIIDGEWRPVTTERRSIKPGASRQLKSGSPIITPPPRQEEKR